MVAPSVTVGGLLRSLRDDRGLSIRALARESGISKSTLSQWETHDRTPSLYELDRVLASLEAPPSLRLRVYALVQAPRGEARVDEILFEESTNPSVLFGSLLRAIRLRSNLTQGEVASRVGVSQAAVAQWESGARHPDPAESHLLCQVIGANEVESDALSLRLKALERLEGLLFDERQSISERIGDTLFKVVPDSEFVLKDLRFAVIGARLWLEAGTDPSFRVLMANCLACYADHLLLVGDDSMAFRLNDRAYNMVEGMTLNVDSRVYMIRAEMLSRTGPEGRVKAIHLLQGYQQKCADPGVLGWIRSDISRYMFDLGDQERAIELALEAYRRECDRCGFESRFRLRELTQLLIRSHRYEEAESLIARSWKPSVDWPLYAVEDALLLADLKHAEGEREGVARSLDDARGIALDRSYRYLLPQIDRAERKLAGLGRVAT